ncbi:MAG TPA: hypothetical protein VMV96_05935 [Acidimicrobiales bacterium]|nr:hypothetical protein [Acidimicrobiales bacterium]
MRTLATRSITAVALAATLGLGVPAAAFATSAKQTPSTSTTTRTSAVDILAWRTWHTSWMTYIYKVRSINLNFKLSVERERSAFTMAMASATTVSDRMAARNNRNAALSLAINDRVAALTAVGNPPAPPAGFNGSAYVSSIQAANIAFRAAVASAQSTFAQALLSATTRPQKVAARVALRVALGDAITARSVALTALGPPPLNPGKKAA